jgi:hypothetical protein
MQKTVNEAKDIIFLVIRIYQSIHMHMLIIFQILRYNNFRNGSAPHGDFSH